MKRTLLFSAVLTALFIVALAPASAADVNILYVGTGWDAYALPNGTVEVNGTNYTYETTTIMGYGNDWANPSTTLWNIMNSSYSGYDIVFFDMVNMYKVEFATYATNAAEDGKLLVSVRTGYDDETCWMPQGFTIRDTAELSEVCPIYQVDRRGNYVLDSIGNYVIVGSYGNPYYDTAFTADFFDNYDAVGPWGTATTAQSLEMAELLVTEFKS
ncbi:hypothetical protein LJC08_02345 [Methanimicrococcus sp. OttesenSCG-928-J09]|nr:hypothetical protein [Methanimicrococcus sp. OttesenSCG-928-J09]